MKIVGFIPYWLDYNKNMQKLAGRHLINYSLSLLNKAEFIDEIVVFASCPDIIEHIERDLDYSFWQRPIYLDQEDITIEEIIFEFLKNSDADIIVLLHPTSPFLQIATLSECIEKVRLGTNDSAFTAYKHHKFAWYKGKPLNYSLNKATPKLKEIEPIILEQASLYVFSRKMFINKSRRIGDNSFIKEINHFEGHDVKEVEDFEIAELIINSGMYQEL